MTRRQYPLESLRKLRDERAQALTRDLASQMGRCQAGEANLRLCERACRAHASALVEAEALERGRLLRGELSGADLLRSAEFAVAAGIQRRQLDLELVQARSALAHERSREAELRAQVARGEADAKLVRQHEAGFHEREAEQALRSEEEAALEQWSARRH